MRNIKKEPEKEPEPEPEPEIIDYPDKDDIKIFIIL